MNPSDNSISKSLIDGLYFYHTENKIFPGCQETAILAFIRVNQLQIFLEDAKINKKIDYQIVNPPKLQEVEDEKEVEMIYDDDDYEWNVSVCFNVNLFHLF